MDGVECLRHIVCRLLDAGELKLVAKYMPRAFQFFPYQGVCNTPIQLTGTSPLAPQELGQRLIWNSDTEPTHYGSGNNRSLLILQTDGEAFPSRNMRTQQ